MRRIQKLFCVAAPAVFAVAGVNVGTVSAASQPQTMQQWQTAIRQVPEVGSGCFQASFPSLVWHATQCVTAPAQPLAPASRKGGPATVGDGADYSAVVTGKISKATGTFTNVSPKITEKGQIGGVGPKKANEFSLQLNTQFFSGSPACAKAGTPSKCLAWQQFVYTTDSNIVFMQYWLIDYDAKCLSGWIPDGSDCYKNSAEGRLSGSALTAASLGSLSLTGTAKAGGNDQVEIVTGGHATLATGNDNVVDLAPNWNTTEWNVFGDGGGGGASFGKNTTLEAVTQLTATTSAAPSCVKEGFTAETNNLKLAATPALGPEFIPDLGVEADQRIGRDRELRGRFLTLSSRTLCAARGRDAPAAAGRHHRRHRRHGLGSAVHRSGCAAAGRC